MATSKSLLHLRLASPTLIRTPGTARTILKRPSPLPLSPNPFPFAATFSIHASPTIPSPHVHFPTSANLTSTFPAFSPNTYDRAAIVVSPNPLAMPAYGDRVYSPTVGVFKNLSEEVATPTAVVAETEVAAQPLQQATAPILAEVDVAKLVKAKAPSRASVRFHENLATRKSKPLPRDSVGKALMRFPRSPYPTAPAFPAGKENFITNEGGAGIRTRPRLNTVSGVSPARVSDANVAARPAPLDTLARKFLSPVEESPMSVTAEERLNEDFWQSVTLEEAPTSAIPQFTFGTKDGGLWSPGLPKKNVGSVALSSVLSPFSRTTFAKTLNPDAILSPTPNDRFSNFPSFASVLRESGNIAYPPRVAMQL